MDGSQNSVEFNLQVKVPLISGDTGVTINLADPTTNAVQELFEPFTDADGTHNPFHLEWLLRDAIELSNSIAELERQKDALAADAFLGDIADEYDKQELDARADKNEAVFEEEKRVNQAQKLLYCPINRTEPEVVTLGDWTEKLVASARAQYKEATTRIKERVNGVTGADPKTAEKARAEDTEDSRLATLLGLLDERSRRKREIKIFEAQGKRLVARRMGEREEERLEKGRLKSISTARKDPKSPLNYQARADRIGRKLMTDLQRLYVLLLHLEAGIKTVFPSLSKLAEECPTLLRFFEIYQMPADDTDANNLKPIGDYLVETDLWLKKVESRIRELLTCDYEFNLTIPIRVHTSTDWDNFGGAITQSPSPGKFGGISFSIASLLNNPGFLRDSEAHRLRGVAVSVVSDEKSKKQDLWRCTVRPPVQDLSATANVKLVTRYEQPPDCFFGQVTDYSLSGIEDSFRGRGHFNINPFEGEWAVRMDSESLVKTLDADVLEDVLLHLKIAVLPKGTLASVQDD